MATTLRGVERTDRSTAAEGAKARPRSLSSGWLPAIGVSALIVVGMGLVIVRLTQAGAVLAFAVAILTPTAGLGIVAFMGSLQPPLVIPSPGFNAVLVASVALGCIYRLPLDRPRIRLATPLVPLFAFVLYAWAQQTPQMLSGYAGVVGHSVAYDFGQLVTSVGLIVVAAHLLAGRSPYPTLALALAAAVVASLLAIITAVDPGVGVPINGLLAHPDVGRAVGSFFNPNYFGGFEAFAVVAAAGLAMSPRSRRERAVLIVTCLILAVGLVLSQSRGAMITLVFGIVSLVFTQVRLRTSIAVGVALLVGAIVLYPMFVQWRLDSAYGTAGAQAYASLAQSDAGRLEAILAGPKLFLTSPLFGVGWGQYVFMSGQFIGPGQSYNAHNWYIEVLAQEGIVGVVLWGLFLAAVAWRLRSRPSFPRSIGYGVFGAVIGGSLFLELGTSFQTSVLPILVITAVLVADWSPTSSQMPTVDPPPDTGGPAGRQRVRGARSDPRPSAPV